MDKSANAAQQNAQTTAGTISKKPAQALNRLTKLDLTAPHQNMFSEENCESPGQGNATAVKLDAGKDVTIYKSDGREYQEVIDTNNCPDIFCFEYLKIRISITRYEL